MIGRLPAGRPSHPGAIVESLVHHNSAHHYITPPQADGLILLGWAAAWRWPRP
jgi:hypothetical protein